jgi:putative nucleotidyltransferase with HDIG domain
MSDITLIELSDFNKKLLKDLSNKAPGTFQHSLQVANLAEAVINEIGGNALLARVGALYHDIGKMQTPKFFTENQKDNVNPHDELDNKASTKILADHVTNGIQLARKNKLPKAIINFIATHHGTSRAEFFFQKYVNAHPDEVVDDMDFRYPGPKPMSKEMGVVMIVDSVEAASRSLKDPSEEHLHNIVDKIVEQKLLDKQFENTNITLKEINVTKNILKRYLISIYHSRIEYPNEEK